MKLSQLTSDEACSPFEDHSGDKKSESFDFSLDTQLQQPISTHPRNISVCKYIK